MDAVLVILKLLDVMVAITGALPQIEALKAKLAQFQAEGRDPSPEEWAELFGAITTDSERLDEADKRLNPD